MIKTVPRNASDELVFSIIRGWVDVLARKDYQAIFDALGFSLAHFEQSAEGIRKTIEYYRSPEYYPGVSEFFVSDWRLARGGNPTPKREVTRYKKSEIRMTGAVAFDLPLNGRWSDLRADFVMFDSNNPADGYRLVLEEIHSFKQTQRDIEEREKSQEGKLPK